MKSRALLAIGGVLLVALAFFLVYGRRSDQGREAPSGRSSTEGSASSTAADSGIVRTVPSRAPLASPFDLAILHSRLRYVDLEVQGVIGSAPPVGVLLSGRTLTVGDTFDVWTVAKLSSEGMTLSAPPDHRLELTWERPSARTRAPEPTEEEAFFAGDGDAFEVEELGE